MPTSFNVLRDAIFCTFKSFVSVLQMGNANVGDTLVLVVDERKGATLFHCVSGTYRHECKPGWIITSIIAEDQWDDDTGGTAQLMDGGVGKSYADIKIESNLCRGYHFKIFVTERKA